MAISKDSDDMVDPGQAGKPDLDVWRAEAGAALAIADGATPGPWETDGGDVVETVNPIDDVDEDCSDVCEVLHYRASDDADEHGTAAFIAAARTGWPRDAARVAVLVERVAALEVALGEALDEFEDAIQYKLDFLVTKHGDRATIARLRAIAAGTAAAVGEEPAR